MAYIIGSKQSTATGATGVEIKVLEGVFTEGVGVVFPIILPPSYMILVNGVTFSKSKFEKLTSNTIAFEGYIMEGDLVQLQFLELF